MTYGDLGTPIQNVHQRRDDAQFDGVLQSNGAFSSPPDPDQRSYPNQGESHDRAEQIDEDPVDEDQIDMNAIALQISASLDSQTILKTTVEAILQALHADRAVAYGVEGQALPWDRGDVRIAAEAIAPTTKLINDEEPLFLIGVADMVPLLQSALVEGEQPGQILSASDVAPPLAQEWSRYGMQSSLALPLVCDCFWVGILVAQRSQPDQAWTSRDRQRLKQITLQAQTMLKHASTYWQLEHRNSALVQQVRKNAEQINVAIEFESTLKRITDNVRDSLDEGEILQTAVRELTELLGLGGCNAALYNLEQGTSTICYEYTNFIPASRGRVAQMNNFPELYNQLRKGMYFQFCSLIPNPQRGRVAMLACPVFVDSERDADSPHKVLGDLWLVHHKDYVFSNLEVRLIQQVANQCAIAIRQARLYQAVQAQVKELKRLNCLKDEFLSTVSHELRTPISNVKMAIHMLKYATDETKQKRYLEILETESRREADLINDLLDLQKLESTNVTLEITTLALQDWLPSLVEPFDSRFISRQQVFTLSYSPSLSHLSTDFNILQRILSELLNNACKYTATEHAIELRVQTYLENVEEKQNEKESIESTSGTSNDPELDQAILFEVRNQVEIPQTELPLLFDKFYRVPNADLWNQGGTGLGLALVQKLVQQIGGIIEVESGQGWTTFSIIVPQHIQA